MSAGDHLQVLQTPQSSTHRLLSLAGSPQHALNRLARLRILRPNIIKGTPVYATLPSGSKHPAVTSLTLAHIAPAPYRRNPFRPGRSGLGRVVLLRLHRVWIGLCWALRRLSRISAFQLCKLWSPEMHIANRCEQQSCMERISGQKHEQKQVHRRSPSDKLLAGNVTFQRTVLSLSC